MITIKNNCEIGINLKKINNVLEQNVNKKLEALGITHSQLYILTYLLENKDKEIYQKHLEDKFNLSNPTVTGILNRLEEKQLVYRNINTMDARYKIIGITQKSLEMEKEMKKSFNDIRSIMLKDMTKIEIDNLDILLKKIMENLSVEKEANKCLS